MNHSIQSLVLAAAVAVILGACGSGHNHPDVLAPLSSTSTTPVDRVVTASAGQPQLAVQGVGVKVDLPAGSVLATVTGPQVPPFVAPPPPAVTATFTISLSQALGTIPVALDDFTITDQLGRTFVPTLVTGEPALPAALPPNRSETFQVNAVLPTGEGELHWAPGGGKPIASWDFVVEDD